MSEKQSRIENISLKYGDPWIWGIYLFLLVVSIVESYSASSREIATQGVYGPLIKHINFQRIALAGVCGQCREKYNNKSSTARAVRSPCRASASAYSQPSWPNSRR